VLLPPAASAGTAKLKFAFFSSDREFAFRGVVKAFADAVNVAADGAVEIELYPGGVLERNYAKQAQLVLSGEADIAWAQPALTPDLFPDNGVMELPGLFRDLREAALVHTRLAQGGVLRGYDQFVVVGALATNPLVIHTRMPAFSLDDLAHKRIRSSSRTEGMVLKALGMVPYEVPITETSGALNRGMIDGATAALEAFADFGISRFTQYHYMLGLGCVPLLVVMNKRKFDELSEPVQNLIRRHGGDWMAARYVATAGAYNAEVLQRLKSDPRRSAIEPTAAERARAALAFEATIRDWTSADPRRRQLLERVQAELAILRASGR